VLLLMFAAAAAAAGVTPLWPAEEARQMLEVLKQGPCTAIALSPLTSLLLLLLLLLLQRRLVKCLKC
jgi:hypothetical protein